MTRASTVTAPFRRRADRVRGLVTPAIVVGIAIATSAVAFVACDDEQPGPTKCLGSIDPTEVTVAAGSSTTFNIGYANPDNGNSAAIVVAWSVSGGGTLDSEATTLTLTAMDDPYGNPGGTGGSTTNSFNATGPAGTYVVHATLLAGGGCAESDYDAQVIVTGSLPDAGARDADAGASEASTNDAGDASEASTPTEASVEGGD